MFNRIEKLSQDVINKIAAGEVIERPASVVKELVDNSVDAGATKIDIKIASGGLKLIEVSDNGIGIKKEDLAMAFEPHATSKIKSLEDLNSIMTMGFRGEALSTIQSVAEVTAVSKFHSDDSGNKIEINNGKFSNLEKSPRDTGTTITVKDIFREIPARLKYMKSPDTEYRKILEILYPYFLIHPEIHFTLTKDSKTVLNLPVIQGAIKNTIHPARVRSLIKSDFTEALFDFFYEGEGIKIGGILPHPKYHTPKTQWQYTFVNNRPISDKGIYKAIHEGFSGYIPDSERIPYIINITLSPQSVDANVHPKKSEVRFANPYRIYIAVEEAVIACLKKNIKLSEVSNVNTYYSSKDSKEEVDFSRLRGQISGKSDSYSSFDSYKSGNRVLDFRKQRDSSIIKESINFSEEALKNSVLVQNSLFEINDVNGSDTPTYISLHQLFNKYIVVEFTENIWVVDQHAAAERVTFERLLRNSKNKIKDIQKLLTPEDIELDIMTFQFIKENLEVFKEIGFELELKDKLNTILIIAIPAELIGTDFVKIFKDLLKESEEGFGIQKKAKDMQKEIIALVSCHTSIRTGQKLEYQRMNELIKSLVKCDNPYSCPHGRPVVWKLSLPQIDKNFDRTY